MRRRGKLVACGSTAMSIIALFAGSLLVGLGDPSKASTKLSRIADQLPMLLDKSMRDDVASFIRQATAGGLGIRREVANVKTQLGNRTIAANVVSPTATVSYADVNTTSSTSTDAKAASEKTSRSEVIWLFDQPGGPSLLALSRGDKGTNVNGFLIGGTNTSDQPLTEVQGTLKPDSDDGNFELKLSLDGNSTDESVRTIPPGAEFSLVYIFPQHPKGLPASEFKKFGGAIFTFHYTHAGARIALICYFSASRFGTDLRNVEAAPSPPRETAPGLQRSAPGAVRPAWAPA